jgi:hypothetical protein
MKKNDLYENLRVFDVWMLGSLVKSSAAIRPVHVASSNRTTAQHHVNSAAKRQLSSQKSCRLWRRFSRCAPSSAASTSFHWLPPQSVPKPEHHALFAWRSLTLLYHRSTSSSYKLARTFSTRAVSVHGWIPTISVEESVQTADVLSSYRIRFQLHPMTVSLISMTW